MTEDGAGPHAGPVRRRGPGDGMMAAHAWGESALFRCAVRVITCLMAGLAAWAGPGPAWALDPARDVDEYTVTGWTMEDGLPHNLVHYVTQGPQGYLWVGTWEGAARFDGLRFTDYDTITVPGMQVAGVRSILPDADGAMLFGTAQSGVLRLAHGQWSRVGGPKAAALTVSVLRRGPDGALWIGTETSLFRLDRQGHLDEPGTAPPLRGALTYALLPGADGSLLIGNGRGLYRLSAGRVEDVGRQAGLPAEAVRSLLLARDGSLWVAGDGGVWRIRDGKAERRLDQRVEALLEDRDGNLWMAEAAGRLIRLDPQGRMQVLDGRHGLAGRASPALFEDREGLLWAGTTNGLFRIADGPVYGIDHVRGLGDDYVRVLLQDTRGDVWIGHASGLDRMRAGRIEHVVLARGGRPEPSVLALAPSADGGTWIGTYDQGVLHLPADRIDAGAPLQRIDEARGLPSAHVRAILQQADGSVWIGTSAGLSHWRDGRLVRNYGKADGLPADFIRSLHQGRDGRLWIGTSAGIAALSPQGRLRAWVPGRDYPAMGSFDFLEDADGTLWIASDHGVLRLRGGRFSQYDHRRGLPRDTVLRVLDDGAGSLWFSSNFGVFRIARAAFDAVDAGRSERLAVEVFDHDDGMPSSQANGSSAPAGWRMRDGRLWFPTARGVAVIDPAVAGRQRAADIALVVESVDIDGSVQASAAGYRLPPEARRLAIRYAGLALRSPGKLRYRYRLAGFDRDWIEAGTATEAVYTSLPPGNFRFEVQATQAPADWRGTARQTQAGFDLTVEPPFWRRSGFIAVCVVLAVMLPVLAYRLATARMQHRQRRLRRLIARSTRELRRKNEALELAGLEREALLQRLEWQAGHDELTGLPNRRAGDDYLAEAIRTASDNGQPFSVGLIDIDRFKRVNDEHGHAAGDAALRAIAGVMTSMVGQAGLFAARHGGEEFLVCLPGLDLPAATACLQAVCDRVAATEVDIGSGIRLRCTISIGVAALMPGQSQRSLLALADWRLYQAKRQGRNRVVSS